MKGKITAEIFIIFVKFVWICLFVDRIYLCVVVNTVVKGTQNRYPIHPEQLSRTLIKCTIHPEELSGTKNECTIHPG
jgi:hypothetical protein